jgi:competence protein ComEA
MKLKTALAALLIGLPGIASAGPININTADARALADGLDGVGPSRAQSIIQWREIHGPFATVDDLADVPGISERFVELNRSLLTVGEAPAAATAGEAKAAGGKAGKAN